MSADEYHKVGTTFRTSFHYADPDDSGSYVTGLTQSDFTISLAKNGTSGQATTGITITESSPAGLYMVAVSASGFVAATGVYELTIQAAADASQRWVFTPRVTSDGTGAGSWGDASFTAVASNGRVMSSGSPLAGATVRITDAAGTLYVQTLSDASGLWGPVYFSVAGTYTIHVQRSLYTTTTGTITVVGSTATGPGTDLSIALAASSTGLTASDLWAYFKRMLRDRSGSQADLLAQQGVDDALDMVSQEREWSWYKTHGVVTLQAQVNTGSIALTNGSTTVTLTGGTWPTWAASGELYIGGQVYEISTRDSATQLTLTAAYPGTTASGVAYVLSQTEYDLPDDCLTIDEVLPDRTWPYGPTPVSVADVAMAKAMHQYGRQFPSMWAIRRDLLSVWPAPTTARTVNLLYYRRPARLVSGSDEADWDPTLVYLLRRAIDVQCSLRGECVAGPAERCMERYREALARAATFEKSAADRQISVVTGQEFDDIRHAPVQG